MGLVGTPSIVTPAKAGVQSGGVGGSLKDGHARNAIALTGLATGVLCSPYTCQSVLTVYSISDPPLSDDMRRQYERQIELCHRLDLPVP